MTLTDAEVVRFPIVAACMYVFTGAVLAHRESELRKSSPIHRSMRTAEVAHMVAFWPVKYFMPLEAYLVRAIRSIPYRFRHWRQRRRERHRSPETDEIMDQLRNNLDRLVQEYYTTQPRPTETSRTSPADIGFYWAYIPDRSREYGGWQPVEVNYPLGPNDSRLRSLGLVVWPCRSRTTGWFTFEHVARWGPRIPMFRPLDNEPINANA